MNNSSSTDLDRVRQAHHLRSLRVAAILRVGVLAIMIGAMVIDTPDRYWAREELLLIFYGAAAALAIVVAYSQAAASATVTSIQLGLAFVDVLMVVSFQFLSTGGFVPLLVMALLPVLVTLEVSRRRAAVVLACSVVAFTISLWEDPVMYFVLGWGETAFLAALYLLLCCAAWLAADVQARHVDEIAVLNASREALLADTMSATEQQRREMSEAIHDGPLQDVLAARQELAALAKTSPSERLSRAADCLQEASQRLRQATFELHPAVLEQVGLSAAIKQLAEFTTARSGIDIRTDLHYPTRNAMDPMIFGVARELMSNVVRHSQADRATITLAVSDGVCHLSVIDNGVGVEPEAMERRLSAGHIGLASHRARVDAAGGSFDFVDEPLGTHVSVRLPLR